MRHFSYTERIRWRIRGQRLLIAAMLAYMVIVGELGGADSRRMSAFALDVGRVIFFGGLAWVIWGLHRNKKLLRSRLLLKEHMLSEQDERSRYLHDKSGGAVLDALLMMLLFAVLTASAFDMTAFYVSLAILIAAVLLKSAAYLYYDRRGV